MFEVSFVSNLDLHSICVRPFLLQNQHMIVSQLADDLFFFFVLTFMYLPVVTCILAVGTGSRVVTMVIVVGLVVPFVFDSHDELIPDVIR
jgi:hypothetical protein